ncbi:MAG: hypothetical protein ACYS0I_18405 [Planctomycetota bacterium]|jgi:hypothetical protein
MGDTVMGFCKSCGRHELILGDSDFVGTVLAEQNKRWSDAIAFKCRDLMRRKDCY